MYMYIHTFPVDRLVGFYSVAVVAAVMTVNVAVTIAEEESLGRERGSERERERERAKGEAERDIEMEPHTHTRCSALLKFLHLALTWNPRKRRPLALLAR